MQATTQAQKECIAFILYIQKDMPWLKCKVEQTTPEKLSIIKFNTTLAIPSLPITLPHFLESRDKYHLFPG